MHELQLSLTPREVRHLRRFLLEASGDQKAFRYYPPGERERWLDKLLSQVEFFLEVKDGPEAKERTWLF